MLMVQIGRALVAAWSLVIPAGGDLPADVSTACARAERSITRADFTAAIAELEQALPNARGDEQVLLLLRHAYRGEIRRLLEANDRKTAERYLHRLRLIEQVDDPQSPNDFVRVELPGQSAALADSSVRLTRHEQTTSETPEHQSSPSDVRRTRDLPTDVEAESPDAASRREAGQSGWRRATGPITPPRPAPSPTPPPTPSPAPPRPNEAAKNSPSAKVVSVRPTKPQMNEAPPPTPPAPPSPDAQAAGPKADTNYLLAASYLNRADALFLAKRYSEAGQFYDQAYRTTPAALKNANDRWAYCRLAQVVERINQQPQSAAAWAEIDTEIQSILELIPGNGYALSLLKLTGSKATETSVAKAARTQPKSSKPAAPVVRASEPDLVSKDPNLLSSLAARIGLASSEKSSDRSIWQRFRSGSWQVLETPNFRIHYTDEKLAGPAADIAESTRIELYRTWFGATPERNWNPKCDIYIHDSAAAYARTTGQGPSSPGHSSTQLDRGRVVKRRVDLRRDGPDLLHAILPHEITHVVMADRFPNRPLARWADEGMAVLTEPPEKKEAHLRNLGDMAQRERLYSARQLMTMGDYPPGNMWGMFYAESVSLVEFLVSRGGPAQFMEFLARSSQNGYEAELKRIYGFNSFEELDREWSRGRVEQLASVTDR